jgi:hypothetical protein
MGAMPVPGPIIMIGVDNDGGRRKDEALTNIRHVVGPLGKAALLILYAHAYMNNIQCNSIL